MFLSDLNKVLVQNYSNTLSSFDILVVGGSALALKYNYRSTVDIDADIDFMRNITSSIQTVAKLRNIPTDWLNQDFVKAPSYSRRLRNKAVFYRQIGYINVYVVCNLDQLCMKMVSGRRKDFDDAEFLAEKVMLQNLHFSAVVENLKFLYGGTVEPDKKLTKRIQKLFKRRNML